MLPVRPMPAAPALLRYRQVAVPRLFFCSSPASSSQVAGHADRDRRPAGAGGGSGERRRAERRTRRRRQRHAPPTKSAKPEKNRNAAAEGSE